MAEQDPAPGCPRGEKQLPGQCVVNVLWGGPSFFRCSTGKLNVGQGWEMGKKQNRGEVVWKDAPSAGCPVESPSQWATTSPGAPSLVPVSSRG